MNSTLDAPTYLRLSKVARIRGVSMSAVVRVALRRYIDEEVERLREESRVSAERAAGVVRGLGAVTRNEPTL